MVRSIILVVIDSLRADHVGCMGYWRPTTPTLDSLANRGILWEKAYSASSWTKPSVASLLTGLYPSEHGAFRVVKRADRDSIAITDTVKSTRPTLAERLSRAGWRCGAFMDNIQLGEFTRLNRGFEEYVSEAGNADGVIEKFEGWMGRNLETPVFAYLHFLEAHWPYRPRRRHVAMFGGNRDTNRFDTLSALDFGKLRKSIARGETVFTSEELDEMVVMYDGAIRRLDGKIKVVLNKLSNLNRLDHALIVITADHGEAFLEEGRIGHGHSLGEHLIHVPLIALVPGFKGPMRQQKPISHVHLADMMLELADDKKNDPSDKKILRGVPEGPIFAELCAGSRYAQSIRRDHWKLHRTFKFSASDGDANFLRTPLEWRSLYPYSVSCRLFDLEADPRETHDLSALESLQPIVLSLSNQMETWWQSTARCKPDQTVEAADLDDHAVQRLRDLGYLV